MLRNWPIRSKLVVILLVPLAALAVLSGIQVRGDVDNVRAADRIEALADFSIKGNDLVHALQLERYATNSYVGSGFNIPTLGENAVATRKPVDEALAVYRSGEQALPVDARETLAATLAAIREHLDQLPAHRKLIDGRQTQVAANIVFYDEAVNDLLLLNARVAAGSNNAELVNGATTLAGISRAKEEAAQQRGAVAQILFLGQVMPQTLRQLQATAGAEDAWLEQFRTTATIGQQESYNNSVGRSVTVVSQLRDDVVAALSAGQPTTVSPPAWLNAADGKIAEMREVERRVATDLAATSHQISDAAARDALVGSIGVAVVLILSIAISLLVASPMISQLRRLRGGALDVANERLPTVVERLHRGEPVDIDAESFPIPATSKDEIGQLAEAFATVHQVAVRTAVEQAAMRKSIGDTFLNLARRSQALIHRQLKVIDALERKETDPDELEELFRLDHLATRMRRHAEDLIVLSGSKPARGWRRPVPVKDVVRGAVAEVEDYTRVKVMPITGSAISGHAVGDVIHMLAELIENATSFSPPHTPVLVSGHEVSNGFVVEIEDRGLGMNPEELDALNTRLANPPPFDLSTSERLGLFVVGRLAERHTIQVQLRPSPYGGTLAIVLLPAALLRSADEPVEAGLQREFATLGAQSVRGADSVLGTPDTLGAPSADAAVLFDTGTDRPADLAGVGGPADGADGRWADFPGHATGPRPRSMFGAPGESGTGPDETLIDDLPVFATARSSWFVAEKPRGGNRPDGADDQPPAPRRPGELTGPMPRPELMPSAGSGGRDVNDLDFDARDFDARDFAASDYNTTEFSRSSFGMSDRSGAGGFGSDGSGSGGSGAAGFGADGPGSEGFAPEGFGPEDLGSEGFGRDGFGSAGRARPDYARADYTPPEQPFQRGVPGYGQDHADRPQGFGHLPHRDGFPGGDQARTDFSPPGHPDGGGSRPGHPDGGGLGDQRRRSTRTPGAGPSAGGGAEFPGAPRPLGDPGQSAGAAGAPADAADVSDVGLPKRRRRANLAPQLRRENADASRPAAATGPRSPEEIRSMMTSFQANFGRGLQDGSVSNDGDDVRKVT